MGGDIEALQARVCDLEEQNDNLIIEKDLAMTKMEQVHFFLMAYFQVKKLRQQSTGCSYCNRKPSFNEI